MRTIQTKVIFLHGKLEDYIVQSKYARIMREYGKARIGSPMHMILNSFYGNTNTNAFIFKNT